MAKNIKNATENIFDLSKIGGLSNDIQIEPVQISTIDQTVLLKDYTQVSMEKWSSIVIGSHIRYLRKDGEFRKGGYVTGITNTQDNEGSDTIKLDLVSNYSPTAIKWSLFRGSIDKIWVKEATKPMQSGIDLSEIKNDIKQCQQAIENIKKDLQKISNEQMRTVMLIKKLHNLK